MSSLVASAPLATALLGLGLLLATLLAWPLAHCAKKKKTGRTPSKSVPDPSSASFPSSMTTDNVKQRSDMEVVTAKISEGCEATPAHRGASDEPKNKRAGEKTAKPQQKRSGTTDKSSDDRDRRVGHTDDQSARELLLRRTQPSDTNDRAEETSFLGDETPEQAKTVTLDNDTLLEITPDMPEIDLPSLEKNPDTLGD